MNDVRGQIKSHSEIRKKKMRPFFFSCSLDYRKKKNLAKFFFQCDFLAIPHTVLRLLAQYVGIFFRRP